MSKSAWTPEQDAALRRLYREGELTLWQIAEHLKKAVGTVGSRIARLHLTDRRAKRGNRYTVHRAKSWDAELVKLAPREHRPVASLASIAAPGITRARLMAGR